MARQIEFTARLDGGTVVWDGPDGRPAKHHKIQVGRRAPPETFHFKLKDRTGLRLRFAADPFQVWENDGSPPLGIATDQIEVEPIGSDKLQVVSKNTGAERTLRYQLNVITEDGQPVPCDPIIKNEGGGPGFA